MAHPPKFTATNMPCCDTVLMTPENSDRAFKMTREISEIMKTRYGFAN